MPERCRSAYQLLKKTASDWTADNAPRLGASLAYYTVFSISPLMLIVVAIAGLWYGQEAAREQIFEQLSGLVGKDGAEAVQAILDQAQRPETGTLATFIAIITLVVGSTWVFGELQAALNTVWGVKPKPNASCGSRLEPAAFAEPMKADDTVPAALKRRHMVEPVANGSTGPATTRAQRAELKYALPIAALFACLWYRERKRHSKRMHSRS